MPIDRSDANLVFGSAQRVGAIRRVERDSPTKQPGEKNFRGGREGQTRPPPAPQDVPHDIVDVSPVPASVDDMDRPQTFQPANTAPPDTERHLDIQV